MLCDDSHTKSESLAQIRTTVAELRHFFLGDCFLLAHPVHGQHYFMQVQHSADNTVKHVTNCCDS